MIKERIIKESCILFVRYSIKTTMDEVAKQLGISKRTIYENFKDKTELVTECTEYIAESAHCIIIDIFKKAENVLIAILQLLYQQNVHGKYNLKYMVELRRYYPDIYKNHLLKYHDKKQKGREELMRKGIEEGVFRNDINITLTSFMFSEQANLIFSEQFEKFNDDIGATLDYFNENDIFKDIAITHIRGISTPKGIEILEEYIKRFKK